MGYTHYWSVKKPMTQESRNEIEVFGQQILAEAKRRGIGLTENGPDELDPICTDHLIWLNGIGDEGHEDFMVELGVPKAFNFCKTAQKPYDAVVVAFLILITGVVGKDYFEWSSDGSEEDFNEGAELYEDVRNQLSTKGATKRFKFEDLEEAMQEYIGFCVKCGAEKEGCEPDACKYECDECGCLAVYGAEELIIMGLVD